MKIAILGGGNIGIQTAGRLAEEINGWNIFVYNRAGSETGDKLAGRCREADQSAIAAAMFSGIYSHICGTHYYEEALEKAEFIVVTQGAKRKPGQTRADLLELNARLMHDVGEQIRKYKRPDAMVIVVSNPVDTMTWQLSVGAGLPSSQIIGLGGELDQSRLIQAVMDHFSIDHPSKVRNALVIGQHGERMVPVMSGIEVQLESRWRMLTDLVSHHKLEELHHSTVQGGKKIIEETGESAWRAPAATVSRMIRPMKAARDETAEGCGNTSVLSITCSALHEASGIYIGLPVCLGSKGVSSVRPLYLNPEEQLQFEEAIASNQKDQELVATLLGYSGSSSKAAAAGS